MDGEDLFIKQLEKTCEGLRAKVKISDSLSNPNYSKNHEKTAKIYRRHAVAVASFVIIIILSISPIVYAFAKYIFRGGSIDKGLSHAEEEGQVSYLNASTESKNITLYVLGAVSDGIRTVIQVGVSGKVSGKGVPDLGGIQLIDEKGNQYKIKSWGTGKKDKSEKTQEETRLEFEGSPQESTSVTLLISEINGVIGNWSVDFPLKVIPAKEFDTNISYCDKNISFTIKKIKFAATSTEITCLLDSTNHIFNATLSNSTDTVDFYSGEQHDKNVKLYFPAFPSDKDFTFNIVLNDNEQTSFSMNVSADIFKNANN